LFTEDVLLNRIAEKLRISFSDQMNRNVSPDELIRRQTHRKTMCLSKGWQ